VANAAGAQIVGAGERVTMTPDEAPAAPSPAVAKTAAAHVDPARAAEHAKLVRAIDEARAKRLAAAAPPAPQPNSSQSPPPAADDQNQDLDKDYIRAQMQDVVPLVKECYEQALVDHPDLDGDLVVTFTIEGEPGVGGVISSSAIDPSSSITDPSMGECVSESMYALELAAPSGGGVVTVTYPFHFSH
jgi:hypothetical protein